MSEAHILVLNRGCSHTLVIHQGNTSIDLPTGQSLEIFSIKSPLSHILISPRFGSGCQKTTTTAVEFLIPLCHPIRKKEKLSREPFAHLKRQFQFFK